MKATVYNQEGKEAGTVELPEDVFNVRWNGALVKQVVDGESANRRARTAHTKIRSEVRGGGKKPWKQKGTGRARHGSSRSPLWKGGGTTFGPRNGIKFEKKINKVMKRKALCAVLSAKVKDSECIFIDSVSIEKPKTKQFAAMVANFPKISGKSLAWVSSGNTAVEKSARNIRNVSLLRANELNALDLLQFKYVMIPKNSVEIIAKTFAR